VRFCACGRGGCAGARGLKLFSERGSVAIALVSAGRQGLIVALVKPRKTFKKVLPKLAAQTRYSAVKNAPLF